MTLYLRLWRLNPYVDKFIIVVSDISHSGKPITISFKPFEKEIMQFKDKIVIKKISMKHNRGAWKRENYQRQILSKFLSEENIKPNDIILVSDCDEIPTKEAMDYIISKPPNTTTVFTGNFYYYNYRNLINETWFGTILFRGNDYKNIQRSRDNNHHLPRIPFISLSHCSYCYPNISMIQKKLKNFAHTEFNKKPYTDKSYIIEKIKTHKSLFWKTAFFFVDYDPKINPLPNDERFNFLKEEYGIIEDDLDNLNN